MPIIAQKLLVINANDDLSVSIINKINACGCIQSSRLSVELNTSVESLKNALRKIEGLKCDANYDVCCVNTDEYNRFVKNLHKIGGN